MKLNANHMPSSKAFFWIFLSTLLISGTAWMSWFYNLQFKKASQQDTKYNVIALTQSSQPREGLKTVYLAQLLGLSVDQPTNIYRFSIENGEKKLLSSSLIKEAKIKKILPGTLYIEYVMREPLAFLEEYSNTVLDEKGYLFPLNPYYTPKKLPRFFIGLKNREKEWGETIRDHVGFQLAQEVLKESQNLLGIHSTLEEIDVSQAFAESFGRREIVLLVNERFDIENGVYSNKKFFIRLNVKEYKQNLINYLTLRQYIKSHKTQNLKDSRIAVIDLRIPSLGYLKREN